MRIVIDIEGAEVSARVEHPGGEDAPPPDMLRRAKALGALSAGAAPAEPGAKGGARVSFTGTPESEMLPPAEAGAAPVEAAGNARRSKSPARAKTKRTKR